MKDGACFRACRGARAGILGFLLVAALLTTAGAQAQRRPPFGRPSSREADDAGAPPSPDRSLSRKMLKASYEQLQKDVQRLSDLADELKEQVTKTDDEDILSLSGMKKAEEIEKLAKKIQGRMKNL